jgi:hypothetical protein
MHAAPCGIHGSARPGTREYTLNVFKNRSQAPRATNPRITLEKLARGARYQNSEAAAIIGYVALVKSGGKETCNCRATDPAHTDTHIALVTKPAYANDESKHVVVVCTEVRCSEGRTGASPTRCRSDRQGYRRVTFRLL